MPSVLPSGFDTGEMFATFGAYYIHILNLVGFVLGTQVAWLNISVTTMMRILIFLVIDTFVFTFGKIMYLGMEHVKSINLGS